MARTAVLSDGAVLALRGATTTEDRVTLPDVQLDPKVYAEVKKTLGRIGGGGKWNRKAGTHFFPRDPRPELTALLGAGEGDVVTMPDDPAKLTGFFRTPDAIADQLVKAVMPPPPGFEEMREDGWADHAMTRVLEPSAGDGAILRAIDRFAAKRERTDLSAWGLEPDQHRFDDLQRVRQAPVEYGAWPVWGAQQITLEDFCAAHRGADPAFDVILMNPPFALPGRPCAWAEHVTRCLTLLRPGGALAAILPTSWEHRDHPEARTLRAAVQGLDALLVRQYGADQEAPTSTWERLPEDAFAESGTRVRTGILTVRVPH